MTKVPFAEARRLSIVTESPSVHQEREEEEEQQEAESEGEKTFKERCACPWMATMKDKCKRLESCGVMND